MNIKAKLDPASLSLEDILLHHAAKELLEELLKNPKDPFVYEGISMTKRKMITEIETFSPLGKKFLCQWFEARQTNFNFFQQEYLKLKFILESIPRSPDPSSK